MIFLSIAFTLIAATGLVYLLTRTRTGEHGSFVKWSTYVLLFIAAAVLVCQLAQGVRRMMHQGGRDGWKAKSMCHPGKKKMKGGCAMMGSCCGMNAGCCSGMQEHGCSATEHGGMEGCGMDGAKMKRRAGDTMHSESTTDTVDGKVIQKEITIIEKE